MKSMLHIYVYIYIYIYLHTLYSKAITSKCLKQKCRLHLSRLFNLKAVQQHFT